MDATCAPDSCTLSATACTSALSVRSAAKLLLAAIHVSTVSAGLHRLPKR
jgi:hypothetical protein